VDEINIYQEDLWLFFILYLSMTDDDDIHYSRHHNHHIQVHFARRGVHFYSWVILVFLINKFERYDRRVPWIKSENKWFVKPPYAFVHMASVT